MNLKHFLIGASFAAIAATGVVTTTAAQETGVAENRPIVVNGRSIEAGVGRVPSSWFRRIPSIQNPRLSPNGSHLALQVQAQGEAALAFIDLARPNAAPTVIATMGELRNEGDRVVSDYFWVGSGILVMEVVMREDFGGQRGDATRLVAYDIATGRRTQLAWDGAGGNASDVLHVNDETGHILLQRSAYRSGRGATERGSEVVDVDARTGSFTMVQRANPEIGGWYSDSNGVLRMGVGYDGDTGKRRIMYRSNASETFRTIFNEADPSFTDAGLNPLWISPTSDNAIVRDNKDGFAKIYRVNLANMQYSAPVFAVDGYDAEDVRTNYGGRLPVGFTVTEQQNRTQWTNPTYRDIQAVLDERFGAGNSVIGNSTADGSKFIIRTGAPNQGGTYYIFNTQSGELSLIGQRWAHIGETPLNPVSAFRYTASDGQSIEAILTMPRHRQQTRGLPMVIITHGGPFGVRDDVGFDGWAQAIAELGYVVVQPNYRGSGGYGRAFVTAGRNNGFGLRMQDDLDDLITHMAAQGTVDPSRVCMMGWSYGGYASARAAQRNPEKYRCTIAGAGVYDLAAMREYDQTYLGSFGANYLARGAAELNSVSPSRNTNTRWAPILIVHGARDARVPIDQARTLVSRLRSAGKMQGTDFDYIEQPQNTHNLIYDDVWVQWIEGAAGWLNRWNPAYTPADSDRPVPLVPEGARPVTRD